MIGNGLPKEYDVNVQSQTSNFYKYYLIQELKTDIMLTSDIAVDDTVINVTAGHGFTGVGCECLVLRDGDSVAQLVVKSVNVNAITVHMPIADAYSILTTKVIRGTADMNVDGSVTPIEFKYSSHGDTRAIIPLDISEISIVMQHGTNVPDDSRFGGLVELTNGLYIRKQDDIKMNIGNFKCNQDFRDTGMIITYSDKAPSGAYATNILFNIENVTGQVIRLDPRNNDELVAYVRDDLSLLAGMTRLRICFVYSLTIGE